MNLDKLLAMLCDRSLFMCRLDKFRDPWEGVWPKPVVDEVRSHMDESQTEWFLTFWRRNEERLLRQLLARR